MLYKEGFENSIRRWNAFWCHDVADRPPLVLHFRQEGDEGQALPTQQPTPEDFEKQFDLDYVSEHAKRAEARFAERAGFADDTLPQISGPAGLAVTGWLFGCKVEIAAGIPWVEPILERIDEWHSIDFAATERRFQRILEVIRALVARSQGRYAVCTSAPDGPADMAVRILGEQKLALALYENPAEVESLFAFCTGLWRDIVRRKLKIIPIYGGGTATAWSYWVPGKGCSFQEDFGQMISPRL